MTFTTQLGIRITAKMKQIFNESLWKWPLFMSLEKDMQMACLYKSDQKYENGYSLWVWRNTCKWPVFISLIKNMKMASFYEYKKDRQNLDKFRIPADSSGHQLWPVSKCSEITTLILKSHSLCWENTCIKFKLPNFLFNESQLFPFTHIGELIKIQNTE